MNNISDVGALAVVNATKCLVYLCSILHNSITNTNDILQHVPSQNVDFHTLTFSGCGIGDGDAESLLHFIEESNSKALCELSTKYVRCYSSVHVLDISSNYMSYRGAIALSMQLS